VDARHEHSRLRSALALTAIAVSGFLWAHLLLGNLSRSFEAKGAYLWGDEEWLQLFSPASYVEHGPTRVLLIGSSETREALLPDYFDEGLPGHRSYVYGLSAGTLEDVILSLQYIEEAYGPTAMPDKLVLGISFRMVMNYSEWGPPLRESIDKYSPYYSVDLESSPHGLVAKDRFQSLVSRLHLAGHQGTRYRSAVRVLAQTAHEQPTTEPWHPLWSQLGLTPAMNHKFESNDKQQYWDAVLRGRAWYWRLGSLQPSTRATTIRRDFANLLEISQTYGTELYVVNAPEGPWTELFYDDGVYDEYLLLVREAIGTTPFLNLRRFLVEDEFHDWAHANRLGAIRVSNRVVQFIEETDRGRDH